MDHSLGHNYERSGARPPRTTAPIFLPAPLTAIKISFKELALNLGNIAITLYRLLHLLCRHKNQLVDAIRLLVYRKVFLLAHHLFLPTNIIYAQKAI